MAINIKGLGGNNNIKFVGNPSNGRFKVISGNQVGGITVTFAEFNQGGLTPGADIEDGTGSFNPPVGFTINDAGASGVAISNLSAPNDALFSSNQYKNGYVWTARWAAGSTYVTTPVAMYYHSPTTIVFWIIDPADNTYSSGATGTFNLPVIFTSTTTSTSFQE
jgi:hypothetical protein